MICRFWFLEAMASNLIAMAFKFQKPEVEGESWKVEVETLTLLTQVLSNVATSTEDSWNILEPFCLTAILQLPSASIVYPCVPTGSYWNWNCSLTPENQM